MRTMKQMQAAAKWDNPFDKTESEPPVRVQRLVGPISPEHPEAKCEDCGGANVVWHTPSPIWNKVCRPEGYRCDPMICPTCFIIRAEKAGVQPTSWRVAPEDWPNDKLRDAAQ